MISHLYISIYFIILLFSIKTSSDKYVHPTTSEHFVMILQTSPEIRRPHGERSWSSHWLASKTIGYWDLNWRERVIGNDGKKALVTHQCTIVKKPIDTSILTGKKRVFFEGEHFPVFRCSEVSDCWWFGNPAGTSWAIGSLSSYIYYLPRVSYTSQVFHRILPSISSESSVFVGWSSPRITITEWIFHLLLG